MPMTQVTCNWEEVWGKVIEKGQKSKDKRTIRDFYAQYHIIPPEEFNNCSYMFLIQMQRDMRAKFKFYDALGMWIEQREYWNDDDLICIEKLASFYLEESKRG